MKDCSCPKWAKWVLLIAGILYVAGDLGYGPGLWGINVWHFLLLMLGIVGVTK